MNTIDITQLKKPSIFQIFWASLSILKKNKVIAVPEKIGPYTLVSQISKKDSRPKRFGIGIYTNGHEKVFIKTWSGVAKDIDYHFLMNECRVSLLLHRKIAQSEYKEDFQVPEIIDIYQAQDSLSVVFGFVEGELLENLPIEIQAEDIFKCQQILSQISKKLTVKEKKIFMKRSIGFYIFTAPFAAILLSISKPERSLKILKAFMNSLMSLKDLWAEKLVLAHRDLKPHNVLVQKDRIYLIDCESMVLTLPQYDQVYLAVEPDFPELNKVIEKSHYFVFNAFMKTFMIIHFALDFRNLPTEQMYYLSLLN